MPVLFVAHGSPMNALGGTSWAEDVSAFSRRLPRPELILVVSAHWLTEGTALSVTASPETIHDFYGFPRRLYELRYPCPGPSEESNALSFLRDKGIAVNRRRGLDHGAWSVLLHLFPKADVPVCQLSIDARISKRAHWDLARMLAPLRRKGVLIVGSGNLVHNLPLADFEDIDTTPHDWAERADILLAEMLLRGDRDGLLDDDRWNDDLRLAVPTGDHYLPMIYAMALKDVDETLSFVHEGIQNASVSMRSFAVGI